MTKNPSSNMNFNPFAGPQIESVIPLTDAQKEIWIATCIDEKATLCYNESLTVRIDGKIETSAFRIAVQNLVGRHEILRGTITRDGNKLIIVEKLDYIPSVEDLPIDSLQLIVKEEMNKPFDLVNGPLFRIRLLRHDEQAFSIILSAHHIICDGWSLDTLLHDLSHLYTQAVSPVSESSLKPAHRFSDYVAMTLKQSGIPPDDDIYWKKELNGKLPVLDLPADFSRPTIRTYRCSHTSFSLQPEELTRLKEFSASRKNSLFITLLAAWAAYIYKITNQSDIIIGVPSAGQPDTNMNELVGHCVALLPIRITIVQQDTFADILRKCKQALYGAHEHKTLSFGRLLQTIKITRDPARIPLVGICLTHTQKFVAEAVRFGENVIHYTLNPRSHETFELHFNAIESRNGLQLLCHYNADLFMESTITRWLEGLQSFLNTILTQPQQSLYTTSVFSLKDHALVYEKWNKTAVDYPRNITLIDLLESQRSRTPEACALIYDGQSLTYNELHSRADILAKTLIERGIKANSPVGIITERSLQMMIGIIAIIKAGGVYVPIEPTLPPQRIAFMIDDTGIQIILAGGNMDSLIPSHCHKIALEEYFESPAVSEPFKIPSHNCSAGDLAYIIYTSGSTGKPKGVGITHGGICNRLLWMQDTFKSAGNDRMVQKTPLGFDVSIWELFWPLISGASLVIAKPEGHKDPDYLVNLINAAGITIIHFVPSMLGVFLKNKNTPSCTTLRNVICSGEALPAHLRDLFFNTFPLTTRLHNLYGPTEASVDVTWWECMRDDTRSVIPIGRPVANTRIHIVDDAMNPVPVGIFGELCIEGIQVSSGYLNRPELNKEKFVPNPFSKKGDKVYKTGDLARWLPEGVIEFKGRRDFQVKIRGLRIELEEIERVLCECQGIHDAAVNVHEQSPGDQRLIGYVVADSFSELQAKEFLRTRLPEYMVPGIIVKMQSLPVSVNGKRDRRELPIPLMNPVQNAAEAEPPKTSNEQSIARIWADVLKIPKVSLNDNFFDLGGHSLLLAEVQSKLISLFNRTITMTDLFQFPTVRLLAQHLAGNNASMITTAITDAQDRAKNQKNAFQKFGSALSERKKQGE